MPSSFVTKISGFFIGLFFLAIGKENRGNTLDRLASGFSLPKIKVQNYYDKNDYDSYFTVNFNQYNHFLF